MRANRARLCIALVSAMFAACASTPSVEVSLVEQLAVRGVTAQQTERGVTIFLPDVLFGFDESELSHSGAETVAQVAQILRETAPGRELAIEGHADAIGDETYNLDLSIRRASTVATILRRAGVTPTQLTVLGLGETRPAAPNDGREGRALNRRVEIVVMRPSVAAPPPPRD